MNNMKTTKTFALLLAMLAAGNSAQAQTQQLIGGRPYTFTGTPATAGTGNVSYQWFRNGEPIPGATGQDYNLLHYLAYGVNVEFKRGVISSTCPGSITYTNNVIVSFGLLVGTVWWASVSVAAYQTFAARPDMYTQFYQWNRTQAIAATGSVTWGTTYIDDAAWLVNPCPSGWRLPTRGECTALHNTSGTFADADTKGNAVAGKFYGPNSAKCTLPNDMSGCVFLSAGGWRNPSTGALSDQSTSGYYWSSESVTGTPSTNGYYLNFSKANPSLSTANYNKAMGNNIRCVQTVN